MSALTTNQVQIRPKILTGSPKKNAAWRSFSNMKFGSRPGVVSRCQTTNTADQQARLPEAKVFHARELLAIAGEHFLAQHRPDRLVQLDEARRRAHLGDVARPRQVDRELADRMRRRAGREADDAVAHRDRLVEVVGDEEHRLLLLGPEREHLVFHQLARLHVERREGLVHEDDVGIEDERLREADALSHAARELVRIAVAEAAEADAPEPLLRLLLGPGAAAELEPGGDVLQRRAPRHQAVGLEHVAGAAVDSRERRAEHLDRSAARREQAGGDVEQRALAAAGRADDRDELAGADGERDVAHRGVAAARIGLVGERAGHAGQRERRRRGRRVE